MTQQGQSAVPNQETNKQELKQKLKQLKREEQISRMIQLKERYTPLAQYLKKAGLKFKVATVDKRPVEYFRMDQFKALLKSKETQLAKNQKINGLALEAQQILLYFKRVQGHTKLKYPQQLSHCQQEGSSSSKFGAFPFPLPQVSGHWTILMVLAVVVLVLFPLWPYWLKYYLWLVSYYSTIALVGLIIVRLFLYMFLALFGISFWLFPRLFASVQTIQSFKPLYSISKWEGSTAINIVTRLLLFGLFVYYGYHIYSDPNIVTENIQITKTLMDDINEWGINKMKGEKNFSQSALTDYSKLMNTTEVEGDDQQTFEGYVPVVDL